MAKSNIPYEDIEKDIQEIIRPGAMVIGDRTSSLEMAPVLFGGVAVPSKFISIDNLPTLDKLPFISERKRDFAFRFATEYRTQKIWAKEYNVNIRTVKNWLKDPAVRSYIALARYEQRTYNMAQRVVLNRRVYQTMNEILSHKLTADTIGPIVSMVKFVHNMLDNPTGNNPHPQGQFNVNVGINNAQTSPVSPYAQDDDDRTVTVTPKLLSEMKEDLAELEMVVEEFGVDID